LRPGIWRPLTARCNGHALNALRSAFDYIAKRPAERIEIDRGYLADLTAHELAAERKLTTQVLSFFISARERGGHTSELAESFESSWTAAPREVETTVPVQLKRGVCFTSKPMAALLRFCNLRPPRRCPASSVAISRASIISSHAASSGAGPIS
jgi:hypothetical protein